MVRRLPSTRRYSSAGIPRTKSSSIESVAYREGKAKREYEPQSGQPEQPTPQPPEFDVQAGQEQQERQPHEREDLDAKVGFDPLQA